MQSALCTPNDEVRCTLGNNCPRNEEIVNSSKRTRKRRIIPKTHAEVVAAVRSMSSLLSKHGVEHLAEALVNQGWTVHTLHELGDEDLTSMKITGRGPRAALIAAAASSKSIHVQSNSRKKSKGPRAGRAAGVVPIADRSTMLPGTEAPVDDGAEDSAVGNESKQKQSATTKEFTATLPTANEHARQATIFLEHQRLDRAWPNAHSKLSQTLNLSHAVPADALSALYTINLNGATTRVSPPRKHNQGFQAKFCPCCADFVAESLPGKWQFLTEQRVVTGPGESQMMSLWRNFKDSESVSIEYAKKRMNPSVSIRKTNLNFSRMMWGEKPVRRVNAKSVPFPSLSEKDLVFAPEDDTEEANRALQEAMNALSRTLLTDTEETKSRIAIEQQEEGAIQTVLKDIGIMMGDLFDAQRRQLEEAESEARALIEGPLLAEALSQLATKEQEGLRRAEIRRWENNSLAIYAQQYALFDGMEANKRLVVEAEEAAARENLGKLLALYNNQVAHVLAARFAKLQDANARKEGRRTAGSAGSLDGRRCPVCRKANCVFFHRPWRGRWRERGGALDLSPPILDTYGDLSTLVSMANEREYEEDEETRKAMKNERKAQRRLMSFLGLDNGPAQGKSPPRAVKGLEKSRIAAAIAASLLYTTTPNTSAIPIPTEYADDVLVRESIDREDAESPKIDESANVESEEVTMNSAVSDLNETAIRRRPATAFSSPSAHTHVWSGPKSSSSLGIPRRASFSSLPGGSPEVNLTRGGTWAPPRSSSVSFASLSHPRPFVARGGGGRGSAVTAFSASQNTKHYRR